jgi:hypothetical protein
MGLTRLVLFSLIVIPCSLVLTAHAQSDQSFPVRWQQRADYRIEITLADDLRTIDGRIAITYTNNSPDTLTLVYLKAFPNAIQKDSYADNKLRRQKDYSLANLRPEQEGLLAIRDLSTDDPFALREPTHSSFDTDNSIITVYLAEPLLPGRTIDLVFGFTTILPSPDAMRMGLRQGVAKAAYWYPQVCVYDPVVGWVNAQYLGWGECYGDYGTFDVAITAPERLVVAATGVCVNEHDVLPDTLREALDIRHYLKPRAEWPHLNFDPSRRKTWHYIAENVNDFAFTVSDQFCIDADSIDGVEVVAYALKQKAAQWIDAVRLGKESIETFSELFLPYQWPVIRICDAFSGMEYPMLTNCGGGGPSPRFALLLYHEIGHQWFMGQIGSNQVDRPALDEGFTTHAEHIAMEKYLDKDNNYSYYTDWYARTFAPPLRDRDERGFRPLLMLMNEGYDKPMIFSYDRGEEYLPYRVSAYYKSAAMHYSLRSILGDSAYFSAMQLYCRRWVFRHPYEDDFRQAMEDATGMKLEEYLRQWFYGTDRLDYALDGCSRKETDNGFSHRIRVKNKGRFVSPVDIAVIWEQGDTTFYTIPPEGMSYGKPGYRLLPVWKQFRTDSPEYEFMVEARRKIARVVVDPHELLMDVNRLNNVGGFFPPMEFRLDNLVYDYVPLDKYAVRWRPDLWYDNPNGVQLGMAARGSYLKENARLTVRTLVGTKSGLPTVDIGLRTRDELFGINGVAGYRLLRADRRTYFETSYESRNKPRYTIPDYSAFRLSFGYFTMDDEQKNRFEPFPDRLHSYVAGQSWEATNTTTAEVRTGWMRSFRYGRLTFRTHDMVGAYDEDDRKRAFLGSDHFFSADFLRGEQPWLTIRLERFNIGGESPLQYLPGLSRLAAVDRFVSAPLFRSPGTIPREWEDDVYLAAERVRGYQDRVLFITQALGGSVEVTPPDLLPYSWFDAVPYLGDWLRHMDQQFFVDFSDVSMHDKEQFYPAPVAYNETAGLGKKTRFYLSAGVSLRLPSVWRGQSLRVDFPLYLNEPIPGDDELAFRFSIAWLLAPPI